MTRKILIYLFALLILVSGTLALSPYPADDPYSATAHWKLDSDCTDEIGVEGNCALGGNAQYNSSNTPFSTGASVHLPQSGTDYIDSNFQLFRTGTPYTITMWVQLIAAPANGYFFGSYTNAPTESSIKFRRQSGPTFLRYTSLSGQEINKYSGDDLGIGGWTHIAVVNNGTQGANVAVFVNGTRANVPAQDGNTVGATTINQDMFFGCENSNGAAGSCIIANVDDIVIWNSTALTDDVIYTLFAGNYSSPAVDDFINISDLSPANNSRFNTVTLNLNATVNASMDFNCSLYVDDVLNQTDVYTTGIDVFVNFTLEFAVDMEDNFDFFFSCGNSTEEENSSANTIYIDNVVPTISVSDTLNNSVSYGTTILADINLSDTNLYAINITIDDSIIVFNKTSIGSPYPYNLSFNPSDYGLTSGVHTLNVWASDTHTLVEIGKYDYSKDLLTKALTYEFDKGWIKVKPINKGLFTQFDTWKEKDRYVFEFNRDSVAKLLYGTDLEFEVTSSSELQIIENSKYDGHIISYGLGKWLDFETDYSGTVTELTRVNKNTIRVYITGLTSDRIVFNSIGGLNTINKNYTFFYGNFTETYVNPAIEGETTTFSLNFTKNASYVADIDATFFYNNTEYTPTKVSEVGYTYFYKTITDTLVHANITNQTFYWDWNITAQYSSNVSNSTDHKNQSRYKMILENCTKIYDGFAETLNFTTVNNSGIKVPTNYEALFTVWNSSSTISRTYTLIGTSLANHTICMHPNWTQHLNTNYEIVFSASGYDDRTLTINNGWLNTTTTLYEIFMDQSGATTAITITLVDENDNELVDYVIKAYKYDLATDSYTYIDSQTSNNAGKAVFNLDVSTDQYMFKVFDDGVLVHTESKQKLIETSYTFRIVLGTSIELEAIKLKDLDYTLSVDNTAKNFTLIWDDSATELIDSINLSIIKTNVTDDVLIYSENSSADSGNMYYNVTANGVYIAKVYVISSSDGQQYFIDSVSIDIRQEYDIFGTDALLIAFLFIFTMTFVGLAHPRGGEISLVLTILGMVTFYALGFLMVSMSGIVAICISLAIILVRVKKGE